jgi:autotransporter-associated beta strand protein
MIAIFLLLPSIANAASYLWIGGDGDDFTVSTNWSPEGTLGSSDYGYINNGTTAELHSTKNCRLILGDGNGGEGDGGLEINAGALFTPAWFRIGYVTGNGTVTQNDGTVNATHCYVGSYSSAATQLDDGTGLYNMHGGTLTVSGSFNCGHYTNGTFNQDGGYVEGGLGLGGSATALAAGYANISGGTLNVPSGKTLGLNRGELNVSGTATVDVTDYITLGYAVGNPDGVTGGTINQSDGTINTGYISYSGACPNTYNLSGGSLNITGTTASTLDTLRLLPGTGGSGGTITSADSTITASQNYDAQAGIVNAVLAGDVGLDKTGSGTVTLMAANTYTGDTTITGGILDLLGGSITSDVSVSGTGSTLKGSGSVVGDVVAAAGSIIEPGDSIGTLTLTGNVALGGTLDVEYDGAAAGQKIDLLAVTGDLDLTGATFAFAPVDGGSPLSGEPYVFVTYTGGLTGTAGGTAPAGYQVDYSTSGQIALVLIPEPSTWILLLLAGLALAAYKRRRG